MIKTRREILVPAKFIDCTCPHCNHENIICARPGEEIRCMNCDIKLSKESLN